MASAQMFCCVADVTADQQSAGADEARWYQAIRDASSFLSKEIGWFMPVYLARTLAGKGSLNLWVPPLLSLSSVENDGEALSASDYLLNPDGRHWEDGPYTWLAVSPDATGLSYWSEYENGVVLTGLWGLYLRSVTTGATIGSNQGESASTLVVDDGGKVSPGMVLLIGSEQELVTGWDSPNNDVTALNGAVSASAQTLTVDDGTLVQRGEIIRVDFEQMKVRDVRSNVLSVVRGWNGSGATAHADEAGVDVYRTVTVERAVNGTTAAAHTSGDAIARYVAPDDIQYLTRQIATLTINKAKGGYQGRSGNGDQGTVYYYDAFPRFEIERIASNYRITQVR